MPKYELLISVIDEPDNKSGHKRKKEGDIVSVRRHPFNWGSKDIADYLIVIVQSDLDFYEMQKLTIEHFKDGFDWLPNVDTVPGPYPEILEKHRFKMPFDIIKAGWIPDLNISKIQNKSYRYQPFKSAAQLVQKFDGKNHNDYLTKQDVDTVSNVVGEDQEISIDMVEQVSLIWDKYKGSFKYSAVKEYGEL